MSTIEDATRSAGRQLAFYFVAALLFFIAVLFAISLLSGDEASSGGIDVANNTITVTVRQEPPQLDAGRSTDAASFSVLSHVGEGLTAYNPTNQLIPGVAERWDIRADGATFYLREDAKWSDGKPITAHDFVFAWRRVVDPATASQYSFIMYSIKNGEAINTSQLPVETLGVRATSDFILDVEFERPTPFFDKLTAFITFFPIRQDFFESTNGRYGADADMLLSNGPYVLTDWVHGSSMLWDNNSYYWNEEKGLLDQIKVAYITSDVNAKLNLFKDGQIADTDLVSPMLPQAMLRKWQIDRVMDGGVFYMEFNHREGYVSGNLNFRKAIKLAQDPTELVFKVLKEPAYVKAESLFPAWIQGVNDAFRKEYPPIFHQLNVAKAREHLELARIELGLDEFPPIVLLTGDTPVSVLGAEYYQQLFAKNLGLEIRIDIQIFKQRLAKMTSGDFDMVMSGWGPDYFDALTFGDLFSSWNLNNRGRYNNPELDAFIRIGQTELDPQVRMNAFGEIQRIVSEEVVIIPMYERGWSFVVDSRLKGLIRRQVGSEVDYNYAYIDKSAVQ
ncbi:MAG: oligopeptide transport system substrate-binding protein [Pseudohongiellaceae bacterium]|jgi:oligopeptide transport system substrate-binding protein